MDRGRVADQADFGGLEPHLPGDRLCQRDAVGRGLASHPQVLEDAAQRVGGVTDLGLVGLQGRPLPRVSDALRQLEQEVAILGLERPL